MSRITRRKMMLMSLGAAISAPFAASPRLALAQDEAKVDPESKQAKSLEYTHDSPKENQQCSNCQLYTGDPDTDWGPCQLFSGKQVSSSGWCNSWVKKSG